jgi:hypothetical protein
MPTLKPIPAHGALGELPPDNVTAAEKGVAPQDGETYESDTQHSEDQVPESLPDSNNS